MRAPRIAAACSALFLATAGCAAAETPRSVSAEGALAEKNLRIAEPVSKVMNFRIRGWQFVDLQHVVLEDGKRRRILAVLSTPCVGLEQAHAIGYTSNLNVLSPTERLLVDRGAAPMNTCYIDRLYRLENIASD